MRSKFFVNEDRVGRIHGVRLPCCQRQRIQSSTSATSPVATITLDINVSSASPTRCNAANDVMQRMEYGNSGKGKEERERGRASERWQRWIRITYSATSGILSYTVGSPIHIEHGGTQPPLLSSSTDSRGVRISGTMWAIVLDVRVSTR